MKIEISLIIFVLGNLVTLTIATSNKTDIAYEGGSFIFISLVKMRQVPLERDINIAVNGCSGFATSTQKGPFMAMLISRSRDTYLIAL